MYFKFIKSFGIYSGNFVATFPTITRTEALRGLLKSYVKEDPARVGIGVNCMCIYKRVQLKSDLQNSGTRFGRSMTAPSPVLSPNSVLPPPSSHYVFILVKKNLARFSKCFCLLFLSFFKAHV